MTNAETTTAVAANMIHKFEAAGLGKAPFKFVGMSENIYQACQGAPVQPGGSCDYCSTAIRYEFKIVSADGRRFKVGSDCVHKTGDAGLKKQVDAVIAKMNRTKRTAKVVERKVTLTEQLADETIRAKLATLPHPRGFNGQTLLSWADWMMKNSGDRGRTQVQKAIKAALAG